MILNLKQLFKQSQKKLFAEKPNKKFFYCLVTN